MTVTTGRMKQLAVPSLPLLLLLLRLVAGSPLNNERGEDDNYEYETEEGGEEDGKAEEESAVLQTPKFVSPPESVLVNEGDTIRLPCLVDRLEGFVMLWKRGNDIITVASQIIDKRVRLEEQVNGNHLVIAQSGPEDAGAYTCQISAYSPTELTHTVRIRTEPVITLVPEETLVARAGASAQLECRVEQGSPAPSVEWRKEGQEAPLESKDGVLSFPALTRHEGGTYSCLADNGFGPQPVSKAVRLDVQYAPHIAVEHKKIETGFGESKELVCTVHAHPKAEVTWLRRGEPVDSSMPEMLINSLRHRHSLTVLSISSEKLGEYQCRAVNSIGQAEKTLVLAGHASPAIMLSPGNSPASHQYTLKWRASSISTIEMFRVEVQREGQAEEDAAWIVNEVEMEQRAEGEDGALEGPKRERTTYHGSLALKDLEPASRYKVRVASRNAFGFNNPEEVFIFATKGAAPVQQPSVLTAAAPSLRAGAALVALLLPLLC